MDYFLSFLAYVGILFAVIIGINIAVWFVGAIFGATGKLVFSVVILVLLFGFLYVEGQEKFYADQQEREQTLEEQTRPPSSEGD